MLLVSTLVRLWMVDLLVVGISTRTRFKLVIEIWLNVLIKTGDGGVSKAKRITNFVTLALFLSRQQHLSPLALLPHKTNTKNCMSNYRANKYFSLIGCGAVSTMVSVSLV